MTTTERTPRGRVAPTAPAAPGEADLAGTRLLAALPARESKRLRESAQRLRPRMREVLHEQGASMEHVWFPLTGVFAQLAQMTDGSVIETLAVGDEGMVGLGAVMGATRSPVRSICQISGWALRVPVSVIHELPRDAVLLDRLRRYAQAQITTLSRSVACNRLHGAEQRYARWVLATHDRVGIDEFPITQDFLAQMLGVTRPTVSAAGQALQRRGCIHFAQGRLTVDDRAGLERAACECYGAIREAFDELLGIARG